MKETDYLISILIYFVVFSSTIIYYHFYEKSKRYRKENVKVSRIIEKIIVLLPCILIPSIAFSFRKSGTDLAAYESLYLNYKLYSLLDCFSVFSTEKGWIILNYISPSFNFALFLSSFIFLTNMVVCIELALNKYKSLSWTIVLLVFYCIFMNIMRQMIAVSYCTLFTVLFVKKHRFRYFFFILIGYFFHKSALLFLGMPILIYFMNRFKDYRMIIVFLMVLMPLITPLLFQLLNILNIYSSKASINININPFFLFCILAVIIIYTFYSQWNWSRFSAFDSQYSMNKTIKLEKTYYNLFIVTLPIQTMGFMATYFDRLTYYFYIFVAFFIPLSLKTIRFKRNEYRLVLAMWFLIYFIAVFIINNTANAIPVV